ncbi:unnamed protein product [Rotaria sordida]|uniref:Uncharacterized protein n=1 Tax=Rotaria sordida TaxID=392033 RepID=A0A818GDB7_9BILA|nr:unnamed protein product [Rotaria sordida]
MGFFVRDLHNHITKLHKEQYVGQEHTKSFTVYRGQGLLKADFDQMLKTQGGLLSFNNFLSTSMHHQVSLKFARETMESSNLVGILFAMKIDPSIVSTPFADIRGVSYFEGEEEILFSMHSIFRIGTMKQIDGNNRLWQVDLTLTSGNDPELHALTEQMRKETYPQKKGWDRLGMLLIKLGQFNKAQEIVSITIEKKCSTDDDCDLELMCNIESHICTCPEPYFWRQDIRACYGCAPGWLKLQTNKCLLYAISHSSGVTWYEAKKTCKSLIAQPMIISNVNEFIALQDQIEYLLNGNDELAASLYFYQGAWVQINNEWSELYTWCNNDEKEDFYDCVQIRQNSITNTICLQYVSCIQQSQYICEASPLAQAELETNIADAERSDIKNRNEEIMIRASTKKPALTTKRTTLRTTTKTTSKTTQKKPGLSINNAADALTNGINAVGQISNALGNVLGGNTNQNSQQPNGE